MMSWYGGGMGPLGWLAMVVFWFGLLALIMWLVTRLLPGSSDPATRITGETALEILDRRLASGEIELAAWQAQREAIVSAQGNRVSRGQSGQPGVNG